MAGLTVAARGTNACFSLISIAWRYREIDDVHCVGTDSSGCWIDYDLLRNIRRTVCRAGHNGAAQIAFVNVEVIVVGADLPGDLD